MDYTYYKIIVEAYIAMAKDLKVNLFKIHESYSLNERASSKSCIKAFILTLSLKNKNKLIENTFSQLFFYILLDVNKIYIGILYLDIIR